MTVIRPKLRSEAWRRSAVADARATGL